MLERDPLKGERPRVSLVGAGLYLSACGYLFVRQRSILFQPPSVARATLDARAGAVGAVPVDLVAEDGTKLYAWHRAAGGDRVVLFFPGSGETLFRTDIQQWLVHLGWDVLVLSYRGYPGSEGAPTEDGLRFDALAAWRYATDDLGIAPERIVLHGMSLGGGIAGLLAEQVRPAALVLESTFLSVPEAAAHRYPWIPVRWLVRDRLDTGARAASITCPVLVVHSGGDGVIPVEHGRALAEAFEDATYVETKPMLHGATLTVSVKAAREAHARFLASVVGSGSDPADGVS